MLKQLYILLQQTSSLVAQPVKNLPAMQETWIPSLGLGRYPGEGNGNPLQYDCLEYSMEFNPYLTLCTKINLGIPWLSSGWVSMLPLHGAQV